MRHIETIRVSDEMSDGKIDKPALRWNKIREYLKMYGYIMNADVRNLCGVSAATENWILASLIAEGRLQKDQKNSHWIYRINPHEE